MRAIRAAATALAVVATSLAVVGCDSDSEAKSAVRSLLRDPGSAQFRNVRSRELTTGAQIGVRFVHDAVTCGEVNARNGYGAYAGFEPFYAIGPIASIPGDDRLQQQLYAVYCAHDSE